MLTPAQLATLKADILATPELASLPNNSDGAFTIRAYYDAVFSPEFVVWRESVGLDEIMLNGFDWVRVDNLSIGKARIWEWLFNNEQRAIDPSKPNIRLGIEETWKGTQADLDVRAAVFTHCKRPATRAEKLFAQGTGTTLSPATMLYSGSLLLDDIIAARSLP